MVFTDTFSDEYPFLKTYTSPVKPAEREIVGRDVEMDRVMAAMMRPELCNVMLLAEAGSGKALADDTLIPVDDDREYLCMGDLRPGDFVLDERGIPTEVLKVFKQGEKPAFEIRLDDGAHVVCNDEHIWQVRLDGEVRIMTLREILDTGRPVMDFEVPVFDGGRAHTYHWVGIMCVADLRRSVNMTCIYVDAPSHLFQCTKRRIVTHNTALVQGTMLKDQERYYLEVDLSHMIADLADPNQMADKLKTLFAETQKYCETEEHEVVLFIDEFHQIVQLSSAAVEALKPLLADSGTRGIRVIAATTYVEFRQWISPNQPLVERLQRINLEAPSKEMVVQILKGMARRYGVDNQFYNNHLFELIYEYTNRYIPANAQPRKSILVLDSMVGWYRYSKRKLNTRLLADVIYESEGVNVAFRVDANSIKKELDEHVFAQQFATRMIENRLQICVSDLNDKSKPMASFLFTGSTGVGKSIISDCKMPVLTDNGSVMHKRAGDIEVGDYLFARDGSPTKVLGVFPQGKRDVYRVTFGDGRVLDVSDNHLWAVYPAKKPRNEGYTIYSTQTLINKGLETRYKDRVGMKYFVPMNQAVQWPEKDYKVNPYVIGVAIGDGALASEEAFTISSDDEFVISKVADLLSASGYHQHSGSYSWVFDSSVPTGRHGKSWLIQQRDVVGDFSELYGVKSPERRIPYAYMTGSIEQRWELVHGLFDTDGSIGQCDGDRYNVSYSTHSEGLAYDVQELFYSLGVSSSVSSHSRIKDGRVSVEWDVHVMTKNDGKSRFFTLPRKLDIAKKALNVNKQREKTFDYVGIRSIEKLDYQAEMVCFYVDNDEHLYQAGQYVVTHNTEVTKQLARILFNDERRLIRFDMTEFANESSLDTFKRELTARVWERPYSIVLLDEIEKACSPVTRILLQVLDDGRLSDENNREVSFINSYIILTTNAGSEIYKTMAQYDADDEGSGKMLHKYDKLIRESISTTAGSNRFPPELLGRIDTIVPFQPLSEETQRKIVSTKLKKLSQSVREKHSVDVRIKKRVVDYIVMDNLDTDSNAGGARAAIAKLDSEVTTAVAKYVNSHPDHAHICVDIEGQMAFEDKSKLESEAHVVVYPVAGTNPVTNR